MNILNLFNKKNVELDKKAALMEAEENNLRDLYAELDEANKKFDYATTPELVEAVILEMQSVEAKIAYFKNNLAPTKNRVTREQLFNGEAI